tara:strand:- start:89 stop:2068 length:1980 start_codon:yes stop_codon:yes gene_type:complete
MLIFKNYKLSLPVFLLFTVIFLSQCDQFFLLEYLKIKLNNLDSFRTDEIRTQFIAESNNGRFCYLTVSETIFNQSGNVELFKIYFPRMARVIIQQILIIFVISKVLFVKKYQPHDFFANYSTFFVITLIGTVINYFVVSIYVNFEGITYTLIFLFFTVFKSYIIFKFLNSTKNHFKLFVLCLFPLFSTGFGINWMLDFLVYYFLYQAINNFNFYKNKYFILFSIVLLLSLISSFALSPSIETQIKKDPANLNQIVDNIDFENDKSTYLEREDIRYLKENYLSLDLQDFDNKVDTLARNLKGTDYPNRWGIMVSFLPDTLYHIPSFIWYLTLTFLFTQLIKQIRESDINEIKKIVSSVSNLLILYPLLSIFLGISIFFNSMSEFFFFLQRNSEILNFGEIQTWRGISSHYEIFSNLQLFIFSFMLLNYYFNKSVKNYLFILFPFASLMLSQSRFTTLVFFVILGVTFINFRKKYLKEFMSIFIILILILQVIPTFDRTEPFLAEPTDPNVISPKLVNIYSFKPLSDRLNRTVPWTFFLSGYEPNYVELIFGHGTGAYLNIVKLTDEKPVSGPHSLIFQILNKFGLLGAVVFICVYLFFIKHIIARKKLLIQLSLMGILILLLGLEIKTDSLMLVSGVAIFYFNFLLCFLFEKIYSLEIEK